MERRISIDPIDIAVDSNHNSNSTAPSILDGPYWQLDSNRPRTRRSRSTPPVSRSRTRRSAATSGSHGTPVSVAIVPMATAMDADLSALLKDILKDPIDGPIRKSFDAIGIEVILDFLASPDKILDGMSYDDNGTEQPVHPLQIHKTKLLRDFLTDRNNQGISLQSSSFDKDDYKLFITRGGKIIAPPVPASVVNAIQAQVDLDKTVLPHWERATRNVPDHEVLNNDADKITADPVDSTTIVSNAMTTMNATSVADNGLAIVTSRYASLTHIGRSTTTKEQTDLPKDSKKICIHGPASKEDLDTTCYSDTYFDKGRSRAV